MVDARQTEVVLARSELNTNNKLLITHHDLGIDALAEVTRVQSHARAWFAVILAKEIILARMQTPGFATHS